MVHHPILLVHFIKQIYHGVMFFFIILLLFLIDTKRERVLLNGHVSGFTIVTYRTRTIINRGYYFFSLFCAVGFSLMFGNIPLKLRSY